MRVHQPQRRRTNLLYSGGLVIATWLALTCAAAAQGQPTQPPPEGARFELRDATFAVVTKKAGIAARLAHDHLIVAPTPQGLDVAIELNDLKSSRFSLTVPVEELIVDDPALQSRLAPRLKELGLLEQDFSELDTSDREKIRKAMLSKDQLHSKEHAHIRFAVDAIRQVRDTYEIDVSVTIRQRTVKVAATGNVERDGDALRIEATAKMAFSDFGIEPYSALLGAIRNEDELSLYALVEGVVSAAASP